MRLYGGNGTTSGGSVRFEAGSASGGVGGDAVFMAGDGLEGGSLQVRAGTGAYNEGMLQDAGGFVAIESGSSEMGTSGNITSGPPASPNYFASYFEAPTADPNFISSSIWRMQAHRVRTGTRRGTRAPGRGGSRVSYKV